MTNEMVRCITSAFEAHGFVVKVDKGEYFTDIRCTLGKLVVDVCNNGSAIFVDYSASVGEYIKSDMHRVALLAKEIAEKIQEES